MSDYTAEDLAYIRGMKIADACVDELRDENVMLKMQVVGLKVYGDRMSGKRFFWFIATVAGWTVAVIGWWAFWVVTR